MDELPEFLNILKGDMSLVGPRPLAVRYLPFYLGEERRRHVARPGLTGLAQVRGRNSATWEERFACDLEYIEDITFIGDLKILALTIVKVVQRADIQEREGYTLTDFDVYRAPPSNERDAGRLIRDSAR